LFPLLFVQTKQVVHTILELSPLVVAEYDVKQLHISMRHVSVDLSCKEQVVYADLIEDKDLNGQRPPAANVEDVGERFPTEFAETDI
jgi:hypothetical protein